MTGRSDHDGRTTELLAPALTTCAGCAMAVAFRQLLMEVGPRSMVVIPPGCAYIFTGLGGRTPLQIPGFMGNLGATAAFLSGIEAGLDMVNRSDINVIGFAGDGATVDIGLQSLSGALERGHRFLYVCYDNEGYMNTGAQGSGSTPLGGWTSTTPVGKDSPRKDIASIAIAHGAPYVATASVAYPAEFRESVRRGLETDGPAFIHLQIPCPTGWRFPAARTLEIARLAVQTGVFPLYEVVQGRRRSIQPRGELRPLKEYMSAQGRFSHLTPEHMTTIHKEMEQSIQKTMEWLAEASDEIS